MTNGRLPLGRASATASPGSAAGTGRDTSVRYALSLRRRRNLRVRRVRGSRETFRQTQMAGKPAAGQACCASGSRVWRTDPDRLLSARWRCLARCTLIFGSRFDRAIMPTPPRRGRPIQPKTTNTRHRLQTYRRCGTSTPSSSNTPQYPRNRLLRPSAASAPAAAPWS
jgi:hypothetical protein